MFNDNNIEDENIFEDEKTFEQMDTKNIKPMCNYLFNKNLANSLNQYKDNEIAAMDGGFCVSRGYMYPLTANQVAESCNEQTEYHGYISSVKAREYKIDSTVVYRIRVVCHLIVENEIVEFYTEFPSTISPTSKFSVFLIEMGVPVFNFVQHSVIDLDCWLKDRNISATLKKYEKNDKVYYYLNKIRPRTV